MSWISPGPAQTEPLCPLAPPSKLAYLLLAPFHRLRIELHLEINLLKIRYAGFVIEISRLLLELGLATNTHFPVLLEASQSCPHPKAITSYKFNSRYINPLNNSELPGYDSSISTIHKLVVSHQI